MRLPEGARRHAVQDVGEDAGVHVPAAHDAPYQLARREAAMHDGEQHVLAVAVAAGARARAALRGRDRGDLEQLDADLLRAPSPEGEPGEGARVVGLARGLRGDAPG